MMANSKFLLLIILYLGVTSVESKQQECPCNPMENAGGFCACYTCLDHKKWKSTDRKLRPGGQHIPRDQLYAPFKYLCPDARNAHWDDVKLYKWAESSKQPQGDSYQPGAIVYERYHDEWESSYQKAIRNKDAPEPNPCKRTSKTSKRRTYAVCWYWIDYRATKAKIKQAKAAQHIEQNDKHIIGDFFFCTIESQFVNCIQYLNEYVHVL